MFIPKELTIDPMSLFRALSGRMECFVHILIRQQSRCLVVWHLNITPSKLSPISNHVKTFTSNLLMSQNNKLLMLGMLMRLLNCPISMSTQSSPNQECTGHSQTCRISIGMSLKPKRRSQNSTIVCGQGRPSNTMPTVISQSKTPTMS